MTNQEFCNELRNIIILLDEHREWQYLQPDKYNSVKRTVTHQFLQLLTRKTGISIGKISFDISIETLRNASISDAKKIVNKIKREFISIKRRLLDEKQKHICDIKIDKCMKIVENLH